MPEINLKDHYPDAHQQDCFIEVTQEIFEVMHEMVRREKRICAKCVVIMHSTPWTILMLNMNVMCCTF